MQITKSRSDSKVSNAKVSSRRDIFAALAVNKHPVRTPFPLNFVEQGSPCMALARVAGPAKPQVFRGCCYFCQLFSARGNVKLSFQYPGPDCASVKYLGKRFAYLVCPEDMDPNPCPKIPPPPTHQEDQFRKPSESAALLSSIRTQLSKERHLMCEEVFDCLNGGS